MSVEGSFASDLLNVDPTLAQQANRRERKRVKSFAQDRKREKQMHKTAHEIGYAKQRLDQNSDLHPSIHSSQDFWQEIEPRMNLNAEMLDFSGTHPEQEEEPEVEEDDFELSSPHALSLSKPQPSRANNRRRKTLEELKNAKRDGAFADGGIDPYEYKALQR